MMIKDENYPKSWLPMSVTEEDEQQAKQIRVQRDLRFKNIYPETAADERWVGDLGEIIFDRWLRHESTQDFKWIQDDVAGRPDFITENGMRIGVKTVKRQFPPRRGYTAQITASHAKEPIDHFFFMSYEIPQRCMWLLGGIHQSDFLKYARYYGPGEWVHPNYQIRHGHEIYNIDLSKLISPKEWANNLPK